MGSLVHSFLIEGLKSLLPQLPIAIRNSRRIIRLEQRSIL